MQLAKISPICKISTFSENLNFFNPRSHLKLCYKPYTKGENKDGCPLNIKRPWLFLNGFNGNHVNFDSLQI